MQGAPVEDVTALLVAGANPDQVDGTGHTALHIVCRFRACEVSQMLTAQEIHLCFLLEVLHSGKALALCVC